MKRAIVCFVVSALLSVLLSCTKDNSLFVNNNRAGITIQAFVYDTTGIDTSMKTTGFLPVSAVSAHVLAGEKATFFGFLSTDSVKIQCAWNFGDTVIPGQRIVEHYYRTPGQHRAMFTITDAVGISLSDTVAVLVDSISGAAIRGQAFLQGKKGNGGILVEFESALSLVKPITTGADGSYEILSNFPVGTYKVTFSDTNIRGFTPETLSNVKIIGGLLNYIPAVTLKDNHPPQILNNNPSGSIENRQPTISASFSDSGSGISPHTFVLTINGSKIPDSLMNIDTAGFSYMPMQRLPDGIYAIVASIQDSAGNKDSLNWSFNINDAMKVFTNGDTVLEHGGLVKCSVSVQQNYGALKFEIDTINSGDFKTIPSKDTIATYVFTTGNACSWDSVKIRITDQDGRIVVRGFRVRIRPRPLTITSIDSTPNTITLHYSQSQETDFAQYRIYRNTTNAVDTTSEPWGIIATSGTVSYTTPSPSYAWNPRYYKVFQVDSEGVWSVGSSVVYANVVKSPMVSPPANTMISYPVSDGDSIWPNEALRWHPSIDPNENGVRYRMFVNYNNTGYSQFSTELTDTFVQLPGCDSVSSLKFKLMAWDTLGDSSAWSAERTAFFKHLVTDIDGNVYHTVTMGTQLWMVENLATTRYTDNISITNLRDPTGWSLLPAAGYCWYNNDSVYKPIYGALYNSIAATTFLLTPVGWHVPSSDEWNALFTYLGGQNVAAGKLKDMTGIPAFLGGMRDTRGNFINIGTSGYWWSASPSWWCSMNDTNSTVTVGQYDPEAVGYSVRCIRDP